MTIVSCCFQSEPLLRLGEFGVQGDAEGDSPDQDDSGPGCSSSVGARAAHSPVQVGDHGSRLQPADGGQLHRQVGTEVPAP